MNKRDFQRSKVYRAEREHSLWKEPVQRWTLGGAGSSIHTESKFADGTPLMSYDETKNFVEKIMRSRWWKSRMPNVRHLKLKDGRGTRYARGGRYGFRGIVLNIPRWARHPLVILHEMAHTMTPPNHITPSHGPTFCANNLDLIKRWINKDAWLEMKALYKSHKVKFRREKKGQ